MITWTYSPEGQAYISLTDKRPRGHVVESVEVGDLIDRPGEDGPKTLFSIVLDLVRCTAAAPCNGSIVAQTADRIRVARGKRKRALLGRADYTIAPGTRESLRLRAAPDIREKLQGRRVLVQVRSKRTRAEATTAFFLEFWPTQ